MVTQAWDQSHREALLPHGAVSADAEEKPGTGTPAGAAVAGVDIGRFRSCRLRARVHRRRRYARGVPAVAWLACADSVRKVTTPDDVPTRHAWIDATAGVAGDMLLGALVDAGASLTAVQAAVDAVIPGTVRLSAQEVSRAGMRACKVSVELLAPDQPHRQWSDIRSRIGVAGLPEVVSARALAVFGRLAEAEARTHGVAAAEVHFHEVGAWDSIADVVGVAAALVDLGVGELSAGPVALGSGTVLTAHGVLPLPAPAVLQMSSGWRVVAGGEGELATPTGMAVVAALAARCEDLPLLDVDAVGVGAGSRDTPGRANVVRVVLGRAPAAAHVLGAVPQVRHAGREDAVVLEANVDDLDPRVWPSVLADLLESGAADAWLVPILMKKGRPAHTLCVLAEAGVATALEARIFALVPTLGVRAYDVRRSVLDRTWRTVDVGGAPVRVKVGHEDGRIVTATPEFEEVAAAAREAGATVRDVLQRAVAAAEGAGLAPGRLLAGPQDGRQSPTAGAGEG